MPLLQLVFVRVRHRDSRFLATGMKRATEGRIAVHARGQASAPDPVPPLRGAQGGPRLHAAPAAGRGPALPGMLRTPAPSAPVTACVRGQPVCRQSSVPAAPSPADTGRRGCRGQQTPVPRGPGGTRMGVEIDPPAVEVQRLRDVGSQLRQRQAITCPEQNGIRRRITTVGKKHRVFVDAFDPRTNGDSAFGHCR